MGLSRVTKKLVPQLEGIDAAIMMVNASDPQLATVGLFLSAIEEKSHFVVLNKCDLIENQDIADLKEQLKGEVITASLLEGRGLQEIEYRLGQWKVGSRVLVLGVFNAGKTTLINALTGSHEKTDDLPGTTLEFKEHDYQGLTLIDSIGQVVDINMPLMVSVDFDDCDTVEDKLKKVLEVDASAITKSLDTALPGLLDAVDLIIECIANGGKIITCGAGASALVAQEIAGQAQETGLPVLNFTNNLASMHPISFAKGLGEDERSLAEYIVRAANEGDVVIGVSASGGTGFVFGALGLAQKKGAKTIAITENRDTPLGKVADIIIKSEAKPEGPSSSRVQAAHLAIGHALILTIADERGIDAETSIQYMLPQTMRNKKMGIK